MSSRASCHHSTRSILPSAGILADQKELKSVSADGCSVAQVTQVGGSQPCSDNPKQHHWPTAGTMQTQTTTPCRVPNRQHRPSCPEHEPCTSPLGPQQRCHLPHHGHSRTNCRLWAPGTITTFLADSGGFLVLSHSQILQQYNRSNHSKAFLWSRLSPYPLCPGYATSHPILILPSAMEYFGLGPLSAI